MVLAPSFSHGSRDQIDPSPHLYIYAASPLDMSIRGRSHLCRRCHLINLVLYRRPPLLVTSQVFLSLIVDRRDQVSWLLQDFRFRTCNRESDDSVSALPFRFQAVDLIRLNWRRCVFFPSDNCFFVSDQAEF